MKTTDSIFTCCSHAAFVLIFFCWSLHFALFICKFCPEKAIFIACFRSYMSTIPRFVHHLQNFFANTFKSILWIACLNEHVGKGRSVKLNFFKSDLQILKLLSQLRINKAADISARVLAINTSFPDRNRQPLCYLPDIFCWYPWIICDIVIQWKLEIL